MNILHLLTNDFGGAANVCLNIQEHLLECGYSSNVIALNKSSDLENQNIVQYNDHIYRTSLSNKLNHYIKYFYPWLFNILLKDQPNEHEVFTFPYSFFDLTKHPLYTKADIIHLHYVSYLLNWRSFFRKNKKPVVWTMHDMNVFTGGCHISEDCDEYKKNCRECPQLRLSYIPHFSRKIYELKANCIKDANNMIFVAPSEWLQNIANESSILTGQDIRMIRNGIDKNTFYPIEKEKARQKIDLKTDKKIIFFIADSIKRKNKGLWKLIESLDHADDPENLFLLSVGFDLPQNLLTKCEKRSFPFVSKRSDLKYFYSAADITVMPSLYEVFSLVTAESLTCGTPVVAFNNSGQKELIDHKENGYLAEPFDPKDLAKGIEYCLNDKINHQLQRNAARKMQNSYSAKDMSNGYISIYKELLKKDHHD